MQLNAEFHSEQPANILTKREAIAAKVLAGICANSSISEIWGPGRKDWAKAAVKVADALLEELHGK